MAIEGENRLVQWSPAEDPRQPIDLHRLNQLYVGVASFDWHKTPQGYPFWHTVANRLWQMRPPATPMPRPVSIASCERDMPRSVTP